MALFKKKIKMSDAIRMFAESVTDDGMALWPKVKACIEKNGYSINDNDEGCVIWLIGLYALETIYSYQVIDKNMAEYISKNVEYYFDYRIEVLKDWPAVFKEVYSLFMYMYWCSVKKSFTNPGPQNNAIELTSSVVLLGIIIGYEGIKNNDMPDNSAKFGIMLNEFHYKIVLPTLGKWEQIIEKYKVI